MYCVSQQIQHPDGDRVVEVSIGSINYVNPGAIDHIEEFNLAVEAANRAIELAVSWVGCAGVAWGSTGGMNMPFSICEEQELLDWAFKRDESLPQCEHCGDAIPRDPQRLSDYPEHSFCSEVHAEMWLDEFSPPDEEG